MKLVDAYADFEYVGSAAACIVNVPGKVLHCRAFALSCSRLTRCRTHAPPLWQITVDDLCVWLRTGLMACDPRVQRLRDRLTEYQAKLVKVHKNRDL